LSVGSGVVKDILDLSSSMSLIDLADMFWLNCPVH